MRKRDACKPLQAKCHGVFILLVKSYHSTKFYLRVKLEDAKALIERHR
jgi:hypothetical protein